MRSCSTWSHLPYKIVEVHVSFGTFGWLPSSLSMPWRTQVQPSPRCTLLLFLLMWSPSNRWSTRSIVVLEFEVLVLDEMLSFSHKTDSSLELGPSLVLYPWASARILGSRIFHAPLGSRIPCISKGATCFWRGFAAPRLGYLHTIVRGLWIELPLSTSLKTC